MIRAKAILYSIWHGLLPWWLYEKECHHAPAGYLQHLVINLRYARRWVIGDVDEADLDFERTVNKNY